MSNLNTKDDILLKIEANILLIISFINLICMQLERSSYSIFL